MNHVQERESAVNVLLTTGNCINYLPAISLLRWRRHTTGVLKTSLAIIKSKDFLVLLLNLSPSAWLQHWETGKNQCEGERERRHIHP